MIQKLIKLPLLKRLILFFYKKYVFLKKMYYKEIIIDGIIYDLDLRHFIDKRFYFIKLTNKNFFLQWLE